MADVTAESLQAELTHLSELRDARTSARAAVTAAANATAAAQAAQAGAVTAEADASHAVNDARDQLLQDLQIFANQP
jgi:hypothetical protein